MAAAGAVAVAGASEAIGRGSVADQVTGESFELGGFCDEEARRWQEYAERWGPDQNDEGPGTSTVETYVALAYLVVTTPMRVWPILFDLGLVD